MMQMSHANLPLNVVRLRARIGFVFVAKIYCKSEARISLPPSCELPGQRIPEIRRLVQK